MSLINDALKKAQKQRTGESPALAAMPGVGGESAARIAKRARPAGFNSMLTRMSIAVGAFLVLLIGGIFAYKLLSEKPAPAPVVAAAPKPVVVAKVETPPPAPTPAPAPVTVPEPAKAEPTASTPFVLPITTPPPATATPAPVTPAPVATMAVATPPPVETIVAPPPKPKPEPVTPPKAEIKPPTPAPVIVAPVVVTAPPPAPIPTPAPVVARAPEPAAVPRLDNKAVNFIEGLHIAGIRASATDSKVLMNDRVYRVGDMVEHDMGLRLTGITSSSLTFENDQGATYTRNF